MILIKRNNKNKVTILYILILIFLSFHTSCNKLEKIKNSIDIEEIILNRVELDSFLNYYQDDRSYAAKYIVTSINGLKTCQSPGIDSLEILYRTLPKNGSYQFSGMDLENAKRYSMSPKIYKKDIEIITTKYLKENLEDAWRTWKNSIWADKLTIDEFCEYILPYRLGDEPLTSWRKPYREWLYPLRDTLSQIFNSVDAARLVSEYIVTCPYNAQLSIPHRSALNLLEAPVGNCREDCDRTIYAMRSLGIPVAIDLMIVSPDITAPHQWNVVYDTDDKIFRAFDNRAYLPTRDSIHYDKRRKGKVYRQTFSLNFDRLEKYRKLKNPPILLMNPRLKDVTSEYFGKNEAVIQTLTKEDVFLGLYGKESYHPIDIAEKVKESVIFHNIEPNVIYFPITNSKLKFQPCGYPFILGRDGNVHIFKPKTKRENVILFRKYPRGIHTDNRLSTIQGLKIQWSPSPKGPWKTIAAVNSKPVISYNRISLDESIKGGYLRLIKQEESFAQIAEIIISNNDNSIVSLPLSLYQPYSNLEEETKIRLDNYKKMIDNEVLTWCELKPGDRDLILKINTVLPIVNIIIVAHNDDNFVLPGQDYELFYFESLCWKSLGRKIADDFYIEFEAPENAVLLLKNHTKGNEEQIFIYKDGKQLFNQDLWNIEL